MLQSLLAAQDVLISAGIVGSVVVFPMGLALLLAFCFCCSGKKSEKHSLKKFNDCKFSIH